MASLAVRGRPRSVEADRAIHEAVVALLGERGYADLTMAGVAARAGVSTATLYRRFASKEELVVAAVESVIDAQDPADTGTLEGDLRQTLRRMSAKMTGDRGGFFLGLAGELLRHPQLATAVRTRLSRPLRDAILVILDRAVARGEIEPIDDPDVALAMVLGPLHYRLLSTGEPIDFPVVDRILPFVLRALGCRSR